MTPLLVFRGFFVLQRMGGGNRGGWWEGKIGAVRPFD